jgi:hypothetical protein
MVEPGQLLHQILQAWREPIRFVLTQHATQAVSHLFANRARVRSIDLYALPILRQHRFGSSSGQFDI